MSDTGILEHLRVYLRQADQRLHHAQVYFEQARAISGNRCKKVFEQVIHSQAAEVNLLAVFIDIPGVVLRFTPTGEASDPPANDINGSSWVVDCWRQGA